MRKSAIKDFENYILYEDGTVFNSDTNKWLKIRIANNGYPIAQLWKNNKGHIKYVHRLLMEHFRATEKQKDTINHIDGDKTNNDLSNLEWLSYAENNQHAYDNGLKKMSKEGRQKVSKAISERNRTNPMRSIKIDCFDLDGNKIGTYKSKQEACEKLGVSRKVVNNKTKRQKFIFKKVEK